MTLCDADIRRYSRQLLLPELGGRAQERLFAASVALEGDPEVQRACALYLAGAGVGTLVTSVDPEALRALNPSVVVRSAGAAQLALEAPSASSPADAVLQGALLAAEAIARLLELPEQP